MKKIFLKNLGRVAAVLALAASGSSVFAADTWAFGDKSKCTEVLGTGTVIDTVNSQNGTYGNSWTCNTNLGDTTPDVKVTAWSTTGLNDKFATAWLPIWSGNGFGVVNGTSQDTGTPNHAIDNSTDTDLILLDFGSTKIDLDSVKIGYKSGDADISIFRYSGSSATPSPSGLMVSNMSTGGWELVGNYADLVVGSDRSVNTTNKTSSWWLISAYNSGYGGSSENAGGALGMGVKDYFKLLTVAGNVVNAPPPSNGVPEPGSLALVGAAMMGFVASRRRKQQAT